MAENHEMMDSFYRLQQSMSHISDPLGLEIHLVDLLKKMISCNTILIFHNKKNKHALVARNPYNLGQSDAESLLIQSNDALGADLLLRKNVSRLNPQKPLLLMMRAEAFFPIHTPHSVLGCIYAAREIAKEFSSHEMKLIEFSAGLLAVALERQQWMEEMLIQKMNSQSWQQKYSAILQGIPFAALIVDEKNDCVEQVNKHAIQLLGGDVEAMLARPYSNLAESLVGSDQKSTTEERDLILNDTNYHLTFSDIDPADAFKKMLVFIPIQESAGESVRMKDKANSPDVDNVLEHALKLESLLDSSNSLVDFISQSAMILSIPIPFDYFSITLIEEQAWDARVFVLCRKSLKDQMAAENAWEAIEGTDFGWVRSPEATATTAALRSDFGKSPEMLSTYISLLLMSGELYLGNWAFGREENKTFEEHELAHLRRLSPLMAKLILKKMQLVEERAKGAYAAALSAVLSSLKAPDEPTLFELLRRLVPQHFKLQEFSIAKVMANNKNFEQAIRFLPGTFKARLSGSKVSALTKRLSATGQSLIVHDASEFRHILCDENSEDDKPGFVPVVVLPIMVDNQLYAISAFPWTPDAPFHFFDQTILSPLAKAIADQVKVFNLRNELSSRADEMARLMKIVQKDVHVPVKELKGIAALLSQRYSKTLAGEYQEYLRQVLFDLDSIEKLILGLETYEKMDFLTEREAVDVLEIIHSAWATVDDLAKENKVRVSFAPSFPTIDANPTALHNVFKQLFSNAVQAVEKSPEPSIDVGFVETDEKVEFFVKDNGPGIQHSLQEKIFELFYKARKRGDKGAGIGLSIARKTVQAHGGHIWVISEIKGAEFRFSIPKTAVIVKTDSSTGKSL